MKWRLPTALLKRVLLRLGNLRPPDAQSLFPARRLNNFLLRLRPKRVWLFGAGQDYGLEAQALQTFVRGFGSRPYATVSFSQVIIPHVDPAVGLSDYRELVSDQEDLRNYELAYHLLEGIERHLAALDMPCVDVLLASMYNTWAADLYRWICLDRICSRIASEGRDAVAVIDNCSHSRELRRQLPRGWTYRPLLRTPQSYRLRNALRLDHSVFHASRRLCYRLRNVLRRHHGVRQASKRLYFRFRNALRPDHGVLQASRKLYEDEQRSLQGRSPFGFLRARPACRDARILVLVDDSGSRVNISSAIQILEELKTEGSEPLVFTSSPAVVRELSGDYMVLQMPLELDPGLVPHFLDILGRLLAEFDRLGARSEDLPSKLFFHLAKPVLAGYLKSALSIERSVEAILAGTRIEAAVAINESNFLPAGVIRCLNRRGIPTVGVSTVLYKPHPTCYFFPARSHLVYGAHLKELMVGQGIPDESIHVVGTSHYDVCLGRDRAADLRYVRELLPAFVQEKLVVVAAEARPRQMQEIEPAVEYLVGLPDVFTVVKLHPDDRPEEFAHLAEKYGASGKFAVVGRADVRALVNASDLLVTMGSNLIVEAAAMGRISLVSNFSGTPCLVDFVHEGLCFGAFSPAEFGPLAQGLLDDPEMRRKAQVKLRAIARFNGPNDGRSARRIADFVVQAGRRHAGTARASVRAPTSGRTRKGSLVT